MVSLPRKAPLHLPSGQPPRCLSVTGALLLGTEDVEMVRGALRRCSRGCRGADWPTMVDSPHHSCLLRVYTDGLHLWAQTMCARANQGTFRHLAACRKGVLRGFSFVSTASMEKNRFVFFSCQISHFSQLKENQFYFVMCLTREVPLLTHAWRLLRANP